MARRPRLLLPGIPVHIVQRGNDRMPCFRDERDYLVFLALLGEASRSSGATLHAYCLMTNHVHLLATPSEETACPDLMRDLSHQYAQYFNRKYRRTGTLWEGRYRACLVESTEYLVACHRYIERNPVRAGMATHPGAYPWSSYAGNARLRSDPLIATHDAIAAIPPQNYREMLSEDVGADRLEEIRQATRGGYPLVGAALKEKLERAGRWKLERRTPGPKRAAQAPNNSVPDPDLFSGGAVS